MAKAPSFQFYPGDWMRSTNVRALSPEARGLWIDMLCIMHDGNPYGYLRTGDLVIQPDNLAAMTGLTPERARALLAEMELVNLFSRDEDGVIYSRRMVNDEYIRQIRRKAGKNGGNPKLLDNQNANQTGEQTAKQKPTPSSSSSSASAYAFKDPSLRSGLRAREDSAAPVVADVPAHPGKTPPPESVDFARIELRLSNAGIHVPEQHQAALVGEFLAYSRKEGHHAADWLSALELWIRTRHRRWGAESLTPGGAGAPAAAPDDDPLPDYGAGMPGTPHYRPPKARRPA